MVDFPKFSHIYCQNNSFFLQLTSVELTISCLPKLHTLPMWEPIGQAKAMHAYTYQKYCRPQWITATYNSLLRRKGLL